MDEYLSNSIGSPSSGGIPTKASSKSRLFTGRKRHQCSNLLNLTTSFPDNAVGLNVQRAKQHHERLSMRHIHIPSMHTYIGILSVIYVTCASGNISTIFVQTTAGAIALQVIPSNAYSFPTVFVRPITAALDVE